VGLPRRPLGSSPPAATELRRPVRPWHQRFATSCSALRSRICTQITTASTTQVAPANSRLRARMRSSSRRAATRPIHPPSRAEPSYGPLPRTSHHPRIRGGGTGSRPGRPGLRRHHGSDHDPRHARARKLDVLTLFVEQPVAVGDEEAHPVLLQFGLDPPRDIDEVGVTQVDNDEADDVAPARDERASGVIAHEAKLLDRGEDSEPRTPATTAGLFSVFKTVPTATPARRATSTMLGPFERRVDTPPSPLLIQRFRLSSERRGPILRPGPSYSLLDQDAPSA